METMEVKVKSSLYGVTNCVIDKNRLTSGVRCFPCGSGEDHFLTEKEYQDCIKFWNLKKSVLVKFKDNSLNYVTSVNPLTSNQDNINYFVNTVFNMGCYPIENMQKCIGIEITLSEEY